MLGTQVRENVDVIAESMGEDSRSMWIGALDSVYLVHKLFYYAVLAIFIGWFVNIRKLFSEIWGVKNLMFLLTGVLVAEIAFGLSMHHFSIPSVFQPLHLLFATILLAGEFSILGLVFFARPQIER